MIPYFFIFGFIFLDKAIFKNRKTFCIITGFQLYLLIALRSISLGLSDTSNVYLNNFNWIETNNVQNIINNTINTGSVVFNLLTKFIQLFTTNYHIYIAIIGIPYIVTITWLIIKYSKYPLLSFVFFISFYYLFSFFLLRQIIALSIVIISYKYLRESELIKFIICVLLASTFHGSAILFLIAYPFCHIIKFGKKNFILIFLAYLSSIFLSKQVFSLIGLYSQTLSSYIDNGIYGISNNMFVSNILVNITILLMRYFYKEGSNYNEDLLYNITTLGSVFLCFTPVVTEFYRLALYFNIFNVLLISEDVSRIVKNKYINSKNIKACIYIAILILLILYFFFRTINNIHANPYLFYWVDGRV